MLGRLQDEYALSEEKAAQLAPLTLAYIGDSVFDLYVRTKYALNSQKNAGKLHAMSIRLVNARSQAAFARRWMEQFTAAEKEVFMRGRNAKSQTVPKNMSVADYKDVYKRQLPDRPFLKCSALRKKRRAREKRSFPFILRTAYRSCP